MDGQTPRRLLDGGSNLRGQGGELVGGHFDMMAEVEVAGLVERHEMDMDVGDVDAHHGLADLDAGAHLFEALGHTACKKMELGEEVLVEVKDIVHLFLGNTEHMAADDGVDVEESEAVLGLGHLVAWNFACYNLAEYRCHIIFQF